MIRAQRRIHALVACALAIGLPMGLIAALRDRPERGVVALAAVADLLPEEPPIPSDALIVMNRRGDSGDVENSGVVIRLWREDGARHLAVRGDDSLAPDVLAYAAPAGADAVAAGDSGLVDGARLLGPVIPWRTCRFALAANDGVLVLYSLAHQEVVAAYPLPAEQGR